MNFNSILIGSEDPKRLAEYYTKLFGKPAMEDGNYSSWVIGSAAISVGPHSEVKGKNEAPGRIIWNIESADVKADFEKLKDPLGYNAYPFLVALVDGRVKGTVQKPDGDEPAATLRRLGFIR